MNKIIHHRRDEILEIARKYGAISVRIFGSVARGEDGPLSDLDVIVDMKQGSSLLDIVAIKQDIEDLLGIRVDLVTEAAISPYIKDKVLGEAVTL